MKRFNSLEPTMVFVEIRNASLHAWTGMDGVEVALERGPEGRLTPGSIERSAAALKGLVERKSWLSRVTFCCGIGARGVLLRQLSLPVTNAGETTRLLQLQIESDFPLPPEALAWGWIPLGPDASAPTSPSGTGASRQRVLVAAVKKEVVEEYEAIAQLEGRELIFTLSALARTALVPGEPGSYSVLDIGLNQSELTVITPGSPPSVQLLAWGENRLVEKLVAESGRPREVVVASLKSHPESAPDPGVADSFEQLFKLLPPGTANAPLWISGPSQVAALAVHSLKHRISATLLPVPSGPGRTAGNAGLARVVGTAQDGPLPLPVLRVKQMDTPDHAVRRFPRQQVLIAAGLLVAVLAFPYIEALLFLPLLERKVKEMRAGTAHFANIDREFDFLRFLELNQSPHLDAAYVIAQAIPQGARLTSLSLNRNGDVALSGSLRDLSQIGDFRLKLVNSGFFFPVVVEDQSPTPDRQKVNFRLTCKWKPPAEREALSLGPVLPEPGGKSSATNKLSASNTPAISISSSIPKTNSSGGATTNPVPVPVKTP